MFRAKSLEKLQTPDRLDQLLIVVRPKLVFALVSLILVAAVILIWAFVARIPTTVDGFGILLKPGSIKSIQSSGAGSITDISVIVGQSVRSGEVIAHVEQPELIRSLQQQVSEYRTKKKFYGVSLELAAEKRDLQLDLFEQNKKDNEESLDEIRRLEEKVKEQLTAQQQQVTKMIELVKTGVTSETQRLSLQASATNTEQRILRLQQEAASISNQQKQFIMSERKAIQDYELESHSNTQLIEAMSANIRITKERLYRQSFVRSKYDGLILELAASVGQVIGSASRVGIIQVEPQEAFYRVELAGNSITGNFSLIYLGEETGPISYNSPANFVEEVLSNLLVFQGNGGTIRVVKSPQTSANIYFDVFISSEKEEKGQLEILNGSLMTNDGIPSFGIITEMGDLVPEEKLKHLGFFTIGDGKRVKRGMEVRIDPTNVERQRYGAMIGKVTSISIFPVTAESLINIIGNKEVVTSLLRQGGTMLVEAELEINMNSATGYKWTSKGPDIKITAGTTTTCRVTVEERRPVTFAIPLLRKWFLGESDQAGPSGSGGELF